MSLKMSEQQDVASRTRLFLHINESEWVKRLDAQLMVPLVIMFTFYVTEQHNQL